ncbi:hypothetical protein GOGPGP_GOGPGP_03570, partial [Dysosmobacter welbionis]
RHGVRVRLHLQGDPARRRHLLLRLLRGQHGLHGKAPHRSGHQLRQGEPAAPCALSQGQGPHPGADEEARRHHGPQVPLCGGRAGPGDRAAGDRLLAAAQGRLLRLSER